MQQAQPGDMQVGWRLEAFADARLSPDAAAVRRMRARVMLEARERLAVSGGSVSAMPTDRGARRGGPVSGRFVRRGAGLLLAATLSLGLVGGAALAASPGGPLYAAALWVEEAMLPAGGAARADAELALLERRLDEAQQAAARGDDGALMAAVAAYRSEVDDAVAAAGSDAAWLEHLDAALSHHLGVLQALVTRVSPQALGGIEQAISKSSHALETVGGPAGPGGQGGPGGPQQPAASPQGHGPATTAKPQRTPNPPPHHTPKPPPTAGPPTLASPAPHPGGKPSPAAPPASPTRGRP